MTQAEVSAQEAKEAKRWADFVAERERAFKQEQVRKMKRHQVEVTEALKNPKALRNTTRYYYEERIVQLKELLKDE